MIVAGNIYYYHNDHLGTPLLLTDDNQAVVWSADYMPFGEAIILTTTIENNLRFRGQYFDEETGLHYNWHRYYDPATGRYLTPDPIGIVPYGPQGGLNHLFNYAKGNPIRYFDPDGLKEAGYGGWEVQFIAGYGQAYVTCCDGNTLRKHKYRKVCFGAGFIAGVSSGAAFGGQNQSCSSPPQYLLAPELGLGIYGPLGIEGGAGFSNDGMNPYLGGSGGTGFKATVCFYWLSSSEEIGCCSQ
ncbi:MAG: RHS domain-containing protein, partial [Deltaproteobacteria bacterium]|nr:RHS domain-containing protein [Deltaproteobacteria bacterium]